MNGDATRTDASVMLNQCLWQLALSLGMVTPSDDSITISPDEVISAVRERLDEAHLLRVAYDGRLNFLQATMGQQQMTTQILEDALHDLSRQVASYSYRVGRLDFLTTGMVDLLKDMLFHQDMPERDRAQALRLVKTYDQIQVLDKLTA